MTSPSDLSRRELLKRALTTAALLPFAGVRAHAAEAPAASPAATASSRRRSPLQLGVASISLRELSVDSVVSVLQQLDIDQVSVFRSHAHFGEDTPEKCRATAQAFRDGGINPCTTSVIRLRNDPAAVRRAFENVRAAGMTMMTCKPDPEALPLVEDMVREYDIRLAIHNHGPEDNVYPSPFEAMRLIEARDERIGLCIDIGHTTRAGVDPAKAIRDCASRLYDVHLKDSVAVPGAMRDMPVEVGRGRIDIRAILEALIEVKYTGAVAFEYERHGVNAVTGLAESVGYVRGMLAAL